MRTSRLQQAIWVLVVLFPIAVLIFGFKLFTADAKWHRQPPSAWRTATDLERQLMATDFVQSRELLGWTRADVIATFGEPTTVREAGGGGSELLYDAGPDGISDRRSLSLILDASGRVSLARE